MAKKYFIAGTDTDAGKTYVTTALMRYLVQQDRRVMGLKPIAAGCYETDDGLRNDDAVALEKAATVTLPYALINPITLRSAIAPHIAAEQEGKRLSASRVAGYVRGALTTPSDYVFVEGAGGWRLPLNNVEYLSGVVKELQLPTILVVGMKLGCLNHALLTAEAIMRDGVPLVGWVANCLDGDMPVLDENIAALGRRLPCPQIATMGYQADDITLHSDHWL